MRRRDRVLEVLHRPVDGAGLAVFRILFGLLVSAGAVRTLTSGWIPRLYEEPRFLFKFPGLAWVEPWPAWGMYAHYGALAALGLLVALGLWYRVAAAALCLGLAYTLLLDVTNYLNHHYLAVLLALLVALTPLHRTWSVDAWRRPALRSATAPAWALYLLRFQVAIVYVFAGLAKLSSDWLLSAQPLNIWLTARTETALIGPWLDELWLAYAASWAAFLFDTTIVLWLSWRRTRPVAYAVLLGFHALTHLWFNIGMFPFIMTAAATVFFAPAWPRRWLGRRGRAGVATAAPAPGTRLRAPALAALGAYCALQAVVPLRHLAYPGDVLWNEEGMRWSWKVMVREKHGSVTFHVRFPDRGKAIQVPPRAYLTAKQEREMASQPDLILQLARRIAADFRARGHGEVEVRAEALVSLNGRAPHLLVDPDRDLARVRDGLGAADWILPAPAEPARQLRVASW